MVSRSGEEKAAFEIWQHSTRKDRSLSFIKSEYYNNKSEAHNMVGDTFYTIEKPSTKGFILNFRKEIFSPVEFQHYFDYLKLKILEHNYKLYTSDVRIFDRGDFVETIERHYIKPRFQVSDEDLFIQQFGNVSITHVKKDNRPVRIQFLCHMYSDRKYTVADPFDELISHILA